MMFFNKKKARYKTLSGAGKIYDTNGYFYGWGERGLYFNLPPGLYQLSPEALIEKTILPPLYGTMFRPFTGKLKYYISDRTDYGFVKYFSKDKYQVYLGTELLRSPTYVQYFVYFHELGHVFIKRETESDCDIFAANRMIAHGFNPSQIFNAARALEFSKHRKNRLEKYITEKFGR